ncbi:DUF4159 domain-containing protein [Polymorphum gilvum]|uniref:N-terminal double-transmembrane domain protein n=1 Tax=Polymorphum gilvum (strain LMG 25793 / CGMCC 1.9160 / SL003B-26A1) TaxID=991905 RepID=F2IZN0_POLGS|nr:DUF4159 domain-containing protein [Polymorphum gilvum]ADZ69587.1 N-terminal double-transmembrane domain protein [Polymorphum gilvum SL003B-26A1]
MLGLPLAFASPMILSALLLLPVIWLLLRLTPPRPREITFPPTRLLLDIEKREETPQRSPWWLTLLRLLLAAILILALAGPIWRPTEETAWRPGPLWLLVDNGWTSAKGWDVQMAAAERILARAASEGNPVALVATADGVGQPLDPVAADIALERLRALQPRPWDRERNALTLALRKSAREVPPAMAIWLTDGLQDGSGGAFQRDLAETLGDTPLTVFTGLQTPLGLKGLANTGDALTVTAIRGDEDGPRTVTARALDLKGLTISERTAEFGPSDKTVDLTFDLPTELRNDIARVEIVGETAAGALQLVDDSWRRRTVGLISGAAADLAQPLLSPIYYLQRALSPFADLRIPRQPDLSLSVPQLLEEGVSVVMLADVGRLPDPVAQDLDRWIRDGGLLVRFAGPRTAGGTDDLLPVGLRAGDRSLGGSLSWEEPQRLAAFSATSPFAGQPIPGDVVVNRQVLAEPTADLTDRTWAALADGTPLVTAAGRGRGMVVFFHVTADTTWSNLPLSGTFVDLLRRIVALSGTQQAETGGLLEGGVEEQNLLPPLRLLDGYGRFGPPPADVTPIPAQAFSETLASRRSPPGLYGSDDGFRALNLLRVDATLAALGPQTMAGNVDLRPYATSVPVDLRAGLFGLAFLLLIADAVAIILLAGLVSRLRLRRAAAAGVVVTLSALLLANESRAQETSDDMRALEATLETRLAFVLTGNPEIDDASRTGLSGLSRFLADRTALEPGDPIGVDLSVDELAFFSLLYWPIDPAAAKPDARSMARIDAFMRNGGTILFDTRDHITATTTGFGSTPATLKLREILEGLDVPPLEPVPPDHVLTKAFYLLETFPGRYDTSPLWVEASEELGGQGGRPVRAGDGVTPIMITGNDFAAAWAVDANGAYLYPTVPNDPVQRDYAFRAGVNIVMYSLTGNYKADQVHVPALLERLGQ